ncbi:IclR family transcriptional regulator [Aeromicrobium sp. P5_D10]
MTESPAKKGNVLSSALRVLDGLQFICHSKDPVSLSHLAKQLNVSEVAAYRVAQTLIEGGYVRAAGDGRAGYEATWQIVEMSAAILDRSELRTFAADSLGSIADRYGESVTLAVPDGPNVLFVDRIDGNSSVHFYCDTGKRLPLHIGAASRSILAHYPEPVFAAYLTMDLVSYTESTQTDPDVLRADRTTIRSRGYAVSVEDVEVGITGVGAPILNAKGEILGAAAIANVSVKWSESDIAERGEAIAAACREISELCAQLSQRITLGPVS